VARREAEIQNDKNIEAFKVGRGKVYRKQLRD
jgi:hypothetical protein